ncbi:response regulator transcription factor [Nitrospira sp. Kam-Ns4a]
MAPPRSEPIRVLLVDDHEVVRSGLRMLLNRSGRIEVVGEVGTVLAAGPAAVRLKPDVVLMDICLPDGSGVEACREIRAACPATRILFLSSFLDDEAAIETARAGGDGYLLKEISEEVLIGAVEMVARGQSILAPAVRGLVQEQMRRAEGIETQADRVIVTSQEQRILALVARGQTNKQIAVALGLSDKTVRNYLSSIFQKLHVSRRAEAAAQYAQLLIRRKNIPDLTK